MHNLFPNKVRLEESTHTYLDVLNNEYMSFSRFFNEFIGYKFDADKMSRIIAGDGADALKSKWQAQTDTGTRIDKALELYSKLGSLPQEYVDLADVAKVTLAKYSDYNVCYEQLVVYNEEFRTAGMIDKTCILTNRKNSNFHLGDFKCFDKGMAYEHKGEKWLRAPFDYLLNSKYNKITIQLSYYANHLERLTGRKCERLFVDLIVPIKNEAGEIVSYKNSVVPIQYLRSDIELALNMNKVKILEALEPKEIKEVQDEWF